MTFHSPVTMMMVDDNVDEIFLTRRQIQGEGLVNRFVAERKSENLISALGDIYQGNAESNVLILLDINMPRMDGFATLQTIRDHPQFKDLPVLMFSASEDEADIAEASRLGANGYIVKPFTIEAFMSALGTLPQIKFSLVQ